MSGITRPYFYSKQAPLLILKTKYNSCVVNDSLACLDDAQVKTFPDARFRLFRISVSGSCLDDEYEEQFLSCGQSRRLPCRHAGRLVAKS